MQRDWPLAALVVGAASVPFLPVTHPLLSALAAALVVGATALLAGRSPVAALAVVAFAIDLVHASGVDLLAARHEPASVALLYGGLLAYGALVAFHRRAPWGGAALAVLSLALTVALFPILDALGVTDPTGAAAALAAHLAALCVIGRMLGSRAVVGTTGALFAACLVAIALVQA